MDVLHNGNHATAAGGAPREVECRVCGDKASGKHYGVPSCDGCRGFFKRSIRRNLDYICKESGNCIVDVTRRNQCQSCRFKKCLQVNMKRDAVQHERAPRINGLHKTLRAATNPFHSAFNSGGLGGSNSLFFHGLHQNHAGHHGQHAHHLLKHFSSQSSPLSTSTAVTASVSGIHVPPPSMQPPHPPSLGFYPFHHLATSTGMLPLFPLSSNTAARLMFSAAATLPPPAPPTMANSYSSFNAQASASSDEDDDVVVDQDQEQLPSKTKSNGASTTTGSREEEVSTTTTNDQLEFNNTNGNHATNTSVGMNNNNNVNVNGSSIISASSTTNYPSLSSINENIYESAAKLLFLSIKWARSVPSFCALPSSDQCALLAHSWAELFVLSAAQCGLMIEDSFYIGKNTQQLLNAKRLADLLNRITSLNPDHTELACMKAVVLFKPETPNLSSQLRLELLQDQTMIMLQEYCFAKSPLNKIRFGKLLLLFPLLKTITSYDLEELFFKQTVGEVSIQKLITDLVKSTF